MDDLLDPVLRAGLHKGYPPDAPPLRRSQLAARRWNVLAGDLPLPLAVIRRDPLQHNLGWMQRHVEAAGIALAPHGKTTMSPQLFRQQIDAGAWGITFATVPQWALGVAAGVRRAVIANQVVQRADLRQLARLLRDDPALRVMFLLDSMAQLACIEAEAAASEFALPAFDVLVELGLPGGRTGCRGADEALTLARAAHASPAVRLAGVECYEGLSGTGDSEADAAMAGNLMARVHALARQCDDEALFDTDEVVITAGGSAVFDLVSSALRPSLSKPVQGLLRSGCYLTHDDGFYGRMVHVANQRLGCTDAEGLRAALQVWALVQAVPEPGLAILNAGKRDLSHDMGLPVPVAWCAAGRRSPRPVPAGWGVTALNDQHAHLRTHPQTPRGTESAHDSAGGARAMPEPEVALAVGDRVALGVSHPCTTFDKWRWMPVIDDEGFVVDAITTHF